MDEEFQAVASTQQDTRLSIDSGMGYQRTYVMGSVLKLLDQKNPLYKQGKHKASILAAAEYIASLVVKDNRITQKELAAKYKVTEVTLRNRYKEIAEIIGWKSYVESVLRGTVVVTPTENVVPKTA